MSRLKLTWQRCLERRGVRAFAIFALAVTSLLRVDSVQWGPSPSPVRMHYATKVGEMQQTTLQDGTLMHLNSASEVEANFLPWERQVLLTHGEALFTVMNNPSWPFLVKAGDKTIRTTGGKLSIRVRENGETDVLVIEGHAAIDRATDRGSVAAVANVPRSHGTASFPLILAAGESIALRSTSVLVREQLSPAVLKRRIAWTDGWIWFSKDPLPKAVAEFNRYHPEQLVLVDPALERLEIGGRFRSADLESFIAALEHHFDVHALSSAVPGTGARSIYLTGRCLRAQQQCNWPMVQ
jgi:transmembrane sensor